VRTSQTPYLERTSQTRLLAPLVRSAPRRFLVFGPELGREFEASANAIRKEGQAERGR